jgi:pyruvate-formate lyase-activating enzyme
MKIAFVVSEDENMGVEYLSNYLKKNGHQVELVFNPKQFNKSYTRNKFLSKIFNWEEINLQELKRIDPDLVAFSCVTANYQWALSFAEKVKERIKKPIIFGGTHATLKPDIVMENKQVDMVCVGEGEEVILELANSMDKGEKRIDIKNIWFRVGDQIIRNEARQLEEDIDKYEMDRPLFFKKLPSNYRKNPYFLTSRGCPFNCTYCGNEQKRKVYSGKGKYLRQKSVEKVILELKKLKDFGAKRIIFVDDVLTMDRIWFRKLIEQYKKEIALPFICFVHPKMFDEELAGLLKEGRCQLVWYGIQSGSEEIRKKILDRFESNEEIIQAANLCKKFKLKFMVDHIFDIPFDNDIKKSINLYNEIKPYMLNCYNLLYFPSSKIVMHAISAGILKAGDLYKIDRGQSIVYQTGALSAKSGELRDNYGKYALLLTMIPILPKKWIEKIASSEKNMERFSRLPVFLIPFIKLFLSFRMGYSFIYMGVINTELFWIRRFLSIKIKNFYFPSKVKA